MGKRKSRKGDQKKSRKAPSARLPSWELRLYVADNELNSRRARELVEKFCIKHLGQNCSLTVIDVFKDYQSALRDQVLVAPTLVWLRKGTPAFLMGSFEWSDLLDFFGLSE